MTIAAVIAGAGSYGEVYLHYLRQTGANVVAFIDDAPQTAGTKVGGVAVRGDYTVLDELYGEGVRALYAPIGSNAVRVRFHQLAREKGFVTPNFVHVSALVDSELPADSGIFILPGTTIMPCSRIESDVMISANASVAHHTVLEQGVFLSTKASVGANIHVGSCAYVGMGATLVTGKVRRVGANAMLGAGSVLLCDLPDDAVAAGVPARLLHQN